MNIIITDKNYCEKYANMKIENIQKGNIIFKGKYYYFSTKEIPNEIVTMFYRDFYSSYKEFSNENTIIGKQKDLRCSKNCLKENLFKASKLYDEDITINCLYSRYTKKEYSLIKNTTMPVLISILTAYIFIGSTHLSYRIPISIFFILVSIFYYSFNIFITIKTLKFFSSIKKKIDKNY